MHRLGDLTLKQCWYILLSVLIPFICVGGSTYFPYNLRTPLIMAVSIGSFIISLSINKKISFNAISGLWFVTSFLICSTAFVSYSSADTMKYGILFLVSSLMLFVELPENTWQKVITVMNVFVIVIAVSIIASVFIDNLIVDKLSFIFNPRNIQGLDQQVLDELRNGNYSGLAGEKAVAAMIMNVGIAVLFSKYFSGIKCTVYDFIEFGIVVIALVLTGKRMLFLVPIILFVIMILMSRVKHKLVKFITIAVLASCIMLIMSSFIPQMSIMYDRFIGNSDSEYFDVLSGRGSLWTNAFLMFAKNPVFGCGYASYNEFAYQNGYLFNGTKWRYFGHNCYFELLGEVGIVGTVLIFGLLIAALVLTVKYMRDKSMDKTQRRLLMFSFYIQVMFFIYCASGNVLYQSEQIYTWFIAMAITMTFHRKYGKKSKRALFAGGAVYE